VGFVFVLGVALILGTLVAYPLGLGSLGIGWHLGLGLLGQAVSYLFVLVLRVPYLVHAEVSGISVFPVWAVVGTLMVGLVAAIFQSAGPGSRGGPAGRRPPV
jgi:hypothetical protein